ncbi:PEPxxWA-CTERM sorting domain-containing protein, partial [Polymorphobacter multimanifer]
TLINTPDGVPSQDQRASVINYNSTAQYPTSAFGESVAPDNTASASPDAVGTKAAYFVGDFSLNETIAQLTYLNPGNYRVGFSYYLTENGLANVGNSTFQATILDIPVASTIIDANSPSRVWQYASGVGQITAAGHYNTSFVFNSNQFPSKDIVIDRVFAIRTTDMADVIIPPTPSFVPEPTTWAMLVLGFGLVGTSLRRRATLQTVVA